MGANSLLYEIVHCSSWDDGYSPEQLTNPEFTKETSVEKCRGWQTPKCSEYPQDLIIHLLSGPARINKVQVLSHQFKIPTRIDVYIGILKDPEDLLEDIVVPDSSSEEDNMLIEFTRLGYVCFDNNAKAQFRAREFKSIKVDLDGEYVRLVIRNCHKNRLNTHNQVGIVSLDILGQPISSNSTSSIPVKDKHHYDNNSLLSASTRRTSISSNQSFVQRYPSSNVVEIELQQWSTILFRAEEEAVQNEAYHEAKTYQYLGDKLERFTKILSDLEIGKRHAVDIKDYEEATKIKDDIEEIKQTAELLLKQSNIEIVDGRIITLQPPQTVPDIEEEKEEEIALMDDRPYDMDETLIDSDMINRMSNEMYLTRNEEWMISEFDEPRYENSLDVESVPEPIMDEERELFSLPIQLFGEEMITKILCIKSKYRGEGLDGLKVSVETAYKFAQDNELEKLYVIFEEEIMCDPISLANNFINASLMLIQEVVMDSRESIVLDTIAIWHSLNGFCREIDVDPEHIIDWVERAFCGLLKRTGDSNQRIKEEATSLILVLAQNYSTPPYTLLPLYIGKPERMIHNYKEAKLRIELVESTVIKLGIESSLKKKTKKALVQLDSLMQFVVAYLGHAHEEVRETAVKLVITISDQIGFSLVSNFIDESLKLSLADTVKKLVDKDSINTKSIKNDTKKTISELRALTVSARKTPASSRATAKRPATATDTKMSVADKKRPTSTTKKTTTNTRATKTAKPKEPAKEKPPVISENCMCVFCEEVNPEFNEETLVKHYYQVCPVLTCCPMCKEIYEIATLNEHLFEECDKKHLIKECTRCHQAIPVEQWLQHSLKQTCPNLNIETEAICPLCLVDVEPSEKGWKDHLMTGGGCPKLKKTRPLKKPEAKKKTKTVAKTVSKK